MYKLFKKSISKENAFVELRVLEFESNSLPEIYDFIKKSGDFIQFRYEIEIYDKGQ